METQWLKTFVAAARVGTFRGAAQRLYINQATVSHHIARLEESLGFQLFSPSGRGVRLSPLGQSYLAYAQQILDLENKGTQFLRTQAHQPHIHLAASPSLAETILPWLCQSLYRHQASLEITVSVYASTAIDDAFYKSGADGALSRLPARAGRLPSRLLFHDPIRLMTSANEDAWDVQDLLSSRLIIDPSAAYMGTLLTQCRGLGLRPEFIEVEPIAVIKRLVEEGVGVAFLPESAIQRETLEGRLAIAPWPSITPLWDAVYWIANRESTPNPVLSWADHILAARWPQHQSD